MGAAGSAQRGAIASAHPMLPALDLATTEAFYGALGFATLLSLPDYLIVARDGAELHFWPCVDRQVAENTSCYLRSPDVDALHAAFLAVSGLRMQPPEDRPWGMREFYVWDPSGTLLKFGQPVRPA